MYMNVKPTQHKIISFNTTTMTSLGFIGPPPKFSSHPQSSFFAQVPPNYFGLKFLGPPPLKLGGCYHSFHLLIHLGVNKILATNVLTQQK